MSFVRFITKIMAFTPDSDVSLNLAFTLLSPYPLFPCILFLIFGRIRGVCFVAALLAKSCFHTEFYRGRVPITKTLSMPRICERRDSGVWQSPTTSERKVHQGRKYARAGAFKSICFHSRGVCFSRPRRDCKVVLLY